MVTRVLHLIKGLGPGGAEQLLVNQAGVTGDPDMEFHVAYLVSWKNHHVPALEAMGWQVHCLRSDRPYDLRWLWRLRRLLQDHEIDVVHGHSPLVAAMSRLLMRTLRHRPVRTVYTEHNEWGRHRPWTRRLNRSTIRLEDHVLAVSEAVKRSMPGGLEVEVLLHGIDIDQISAEREHREAVRLELGIAADEIVIGTVANFRREKAYEVMLEAAATVVESRPNVRFVSVGQGPLEDEIRSMRDRLGLADRFVLLGYRSDATRVMSGFDVFTLSSHHEGLPVSLMEALALELPVVATSVGGIPDALGSDDIVVPPGDPAALARAYVRTVDVLPVTRRPEEQSRRFDARVAADALAERYRRLAVGGARSSGGNRRPSGR